MWKRFFNRVKPKPKRYVLLTKWDGDIIIARAHTTQSGWIARWIDIDEAWSVLRLDGTTEGTRLVKSWKPYSGWP